MYKQIPSGYKQTKIGVIPEDWKVEKIKKIFTKISTPVTVSMDEHYQQIGIRSHGKGIFYKEKITGKDLGNKSVFWIKADCLILNIVFAWEQAVAKTTDKEVGMIASHRFPMHKPNPEQANINYFLYFFKSKRGKLSLELASPGGAGRNKTLGQSEFAQLDMPLPPLKEQEKIAEILSTWDEAIAKQQQLIEQKQVFKKSMMQLIFNQKIRLRDDNGNAYPDWTEKRLGDISDIKTGKKDLINKVDNGCYPFYVRSENIERINSYSYDGEAILIPGDGKIGEIYHYINGKFDYHQRVYKISNSAENLKFIYYYLKTFFYKHAISFTVKATVDSLRLPIIQSFTISLPYLEEQTKIANFLISIDDEITKKAEVLEQLKQQKKSLMQKLLTGQVRVV